MTARKSDRLVVIGLDCAEPSLVFDAWRGDLPNLNRLMEGGLWGRLESCHPPITVPAWACMMTGRDPGELGIYGFRNRAGRSYDALSIANDDIEHWRFLELDIPPEVDFERHRFSSFNR